MDGRLLPKILPWDSRRVQFLGRETEDHYSESLTSSKAIMSDYWYPVEEGKIYTTSFTFRTSGEQKIYFGIRCFDKDTDEITDYCCYRVASSQVVFDSFDENTGVIKVTEATKANLVNWAQFSNKSPHAIERLIGIYDDIDYTTQRPKQKAMLMPTVYYGSNESDSVYIKTCSETGEIQLGDRGVKEVKRYLASDRKLNSGSTVLMNHFSGGAYVYLYSAEINNNSWQTTQNTIRFEKPQSTEKGLVTFRPGTKYIQPIILANWSDRQSGSNPKVTLDWKDCTISYK